METLCPSLASNTEKNVSLLLPILNTQNTNTTHNNYISILDQAKDNTNQTSNDHPTKPSLTEKLKLPTNKNIRETPPKQVNFPHPPSPPQSLSPKSTHLLS